MVLSASNGGEHLATLAQSVSRVTLQRYLASASAVPELTYGPHLAYGASLATMVPITLVLYGARGPLVVSRILAYLFSLSTITLTIKNVYVTYDFNYPRFVSCLHVILCSAVGFSIMFYRRRANGIPITVPGVPDFVMSLLPISICFSANIVMNNMALAHMGAGVVEMIGGCCPIFVFAITAVMHKFLNLDFLGPLIVVCIGTGMCAEAELNFSLLGIALAIVATFLRALKSAMQHSIMRRDTPLDNPLDPVELLAWLTIPCVAIMTVWSIATEGQRPYLALLEPKPNRGGLWFGLAVSCLNAVVLNLANLFVIKDLGALGVNIVAQLKGILIIIGSLAVFGERVQLMQWAGYLLIVFGVFLYNRADNSEALLANTENKEATRLV